MSLNPNESLDSSNPVWLRRAARGAWVLAIIQVVALAAYVSAMAGYAPLEMQRTMSMSSDFAIDAGLDPVGPTTATTQWSAEQWAQEAERQYAAMYDPSITSVPVAIAAGLMGVYLLANGAGLLLLTVHEQRFPDRMGSVRLASRISAGASAVVGVLLLGLAIPRLGAGWPVNRIESWPLLLLTEAVFVAMAFCMCFYLKQIARRAGRSGLSRLCGFLLFLPLLPLLKAAPFFGLWFLYLLSPLLYLLPLAYIPLSIYLLARCGWLLQRAAPEAEHTWAAESKPA